MLTDDVKNGGAGITFAYYEQDGSSSQKSFSFGTEDFPSIMPENGSPIWPLMLSIGETRFQGGDMPKFYPNRELLNQKDGTPFQDCAHSNVYAVNGNGMPKISYPSVCDMAGAISRFTNITMKISRLLSDVKAEGIDNLAPIFLNAERKPVFIWSQLNRNGTLDQYETPLLLVLDPTDSTSKIPFTAFRRDKEPLVGKTPVDLHSYMANAYEKTTYLVYST